MAPGGRYLTGTIDPFPEGISPSGIVKWLDILSSILYNKGAWG